MLARDLIGRRADAAPNFSGKPFRSFCRPDDLANPAENWTANRCSALQDTSVDLPRVGEFALVNGTHDGFPDTQNFRAFPDAPERKQAGARRVGYAVACLWNFN